MRSRVSSEDRLLLVSGGGLCAKIVQLLLCFNGKCAVNRYIAFMLGTSVMSRRNSIRKLSATRVATLKGLVNS